MKAEELAAERRLKAEREAPPLQLPIVDLSDVMTARELEHPHVLLPYLPRQEVTLLAGHGGAGKSWLALAISAHVACGYPWGPFDVERGRACYISAEDNGATIRRRLPKVIQAHQLPAEEVIRNLEVRDLTEMDSELIVEDGPALRVTPVMHAVADAMHGHSLVVLDNASQMFGADENVRRHVVSFFRALRRAAADANAAVLLLAHVDKAAAKGHARGNAYSGSTAWHNSARSRLVLLTNDSENSRQLLHEKATHERQASTVTLQRTVGGVLMPVTPSAAAEVQATETQQDAHAVLAVLAAAVDDGVIIPATFSGPRTAFHALRELEEFPPGLKSERSRVNAALTKLERDGRIIRMEYRKTDRHKAECFIPSPSARLNAA
jgi:RecA-family ATPase